MINDSIKAVPYDPKTHCIFDLDEVNEHDRIRFNQDPRFCIVDLDSGMILDDAQGYGFKSAPNAYKSYAYKNEDPRKRKKRINKEHTIIKWLNDHKQFLRLMDQLSFEIAKDNDPNVKFNAKYVQRLLDTYELKPDFTASELLRVWKKY